jgi:hypothetical protein
VQVQWGTVGRLGLIVGLMGGLIGCPPPSTAPVTPNTTDGKRIWAVLPAESDAFPIAARTTTERLRRARVRGLDEPQVSKVSLEVVQLSIECVERTPACYEAVGKSLAANELLFAEIDEGPKKQSIKVTVTLFDVDAKQRKKAAIKVFASEEDVVWGVADVVAEATKP